MFDIGAFELKLMGQAVTFDVVTAYGFLCALVSLSGVLIAIHIEKKTQRESR